MRNTCFCSVLTKCKIETSKLIDLWRRARNTHLMHTQHRDEQRFSLDQTYAYCIRNNLVLVSCTFFFFVFPFKSMVYALGSTDAGLSKYQAIIVLFRNQFTATAFHIRASKRIQIHVLVYERAPVTLPDGHWLLDGDARAVYRNGATRACTYDTHRTRSTTVRSFFICLFVCLFRHYTISPFAIAVDFRLVFLFVLSPLSALHIWASAFVLFLSRRVRSTQTSSTRFPSTIDGRCVSFMV